jgi:predicted nuclease with TOPRIM domain
LEQSHSQLRQTQADFLQSQSHLHQEQEELSELKSLLHQTQAELSHLRSQQHQKQVELERSRLEQTLGSQTNKHSQNTQYQLLVWDAWYAYQNAELQKMRKSLEESLKSTPFSGTETIVNWLESFAKFSLEKGYGFDAQALTNSQEWQQLMRRVISVKPVLGNRLT